MRDLRWYRRLVAPVAVTLLLSLAVAHAAGPAPDTTPATMSETTPAEPAAPADPGAPAQDVSPLAILAEKAAAPPAAKIAPALQTRLDAVEPAARELVVVKSDRALELDAFGAAHQFTWPAGEHIAVLEVEARHVDKLAALPGVAAVESGAPRLDYVLPIGPDEDITFEYTPADYERLRPLAENAPSWAETKALLEANERQPAASGVPAGAVPQVDRGAEPDGWFDVGKGHAASEAWELGYTGAGVKVAVMDTGIDFGQQDMHDTWAVMPEGSPYAGWPQAYDPTSSYLYMIDATDQNPNIKYGENGFGGMISMYQVSEVTTEEQGDETVHTACFRPLAIVNNQRVQLEEMCDYKVPPSASGFVRFGHHPDTSLIALSGGELAGVLTVDSEEQGRYDTVYVDLNGDHDFTNDKPATRDDPLIWGELGEADGVADVSGGLLYYLADNVTPVPGAYLWGLEDQAPQSGAVVGIYFDWASHGTLCASNVVSRGRLGTPDGVDITYRDLPGDGNPDPLNPGMAPEAKMVAVGSIYNGPQVAMQSAWRYAVFGHDMDDEADNIQITSNSYGFSGTDNDGWDTDSRMIDYYVRTFSPETVFLVSTGNGAPGYGTLAPPSPTTGMNVAASTQMGSTGWDSAYETSQITFGDIVPWSNRGPTAHGHNGPHVAANGAYAAGAIPVNLWTLNQSTPEEQISGEFANVTWGGTSRSSPVAAGNLSLVYQAFREKHDRWPTWDEARAIFMAGARYAGYDSFVMGAGVVDSADSARIASGQHGVYAMPPAWTPGDYRGEAYPAFAKLLSPGERFDDAITLHNPSATDIEVSLSGQTLQMVDSYVEDVTSADVSEESEYSFFAPDYFMPIDKERVPDGTDLMVTRFIYPLDEADPDENLTVDNRWRMGVFQHTDWDDDQMLWDDADEDGIVDHVQFEDKTKGLDQIPAVDYESSELDEGEYMRFAYLTNQANTQAVLVHHPLERWSNGIYVGLWHHESCSGNGNCSGRSEDVPQTHMKVRVEFYQYQDWGWLQLGDDHGDVEGTTHSEVTVTVPAGGMVDVPAAVQLPDDVPYGAYNGAIFADYARGEGDEPVEGPGGYELDHQRITIPVNLNVAVDYDWQGSVTLGGENAYDVDAPYRNGAAYGTQSWTWRPESGDWRFFFLDTEEAADDTFWLFRTQWEDEVTGKSDIDTRVYGQRNDRYSDPTHEANQGGEDRSDPSWYGPYGMELLTRSPNRNLSGGRWAFNTSSGENDDWLAAPATEGLTEVMLHNVLHSGSDFELPFETTVSSVRVQPSHVELVADRCSTVQLTSGADLPQFEATGFGFAEPIVFEDEPIRQDAQNDPTTASFKHEFEIDSEAGRFVVELTGKDEDDLDLFVLYDRNGDGEFEMNPNNPGAGDEVVGTSTSPTANERVALSGFWPEGAYAVWVQGWSVLSPPSTFDLIIDVAYGDDIQAGDVPTEVVAGERYDIELCTDTTDLGDAEGPLEGMLTFGPSGAPTLFNIPVTWVAEREMLDIFLPLNLADWMFDEE